MKWLYLIAMLPTGAMAQSIERLDPKFDALIHPDATVETLCTGFKWAEGPVWDEKEKRLLFTDVPNNVVYQWKEGDKEASVFLKPGGYTGPAADDGKRERGANGLAFDSKGQLHLCEHGDRRISYLPPNGGRRTFVDNFEGKRFHSPNDLTIAATGDVYFTDPPYGLGSRTEKDPESEIEFCGVYRATPQGKVTLLTKEFSRPNGIALSADGKTLFIGQSGNPAVIKRYPVIADGSIGEGEVFFDMKNVGGRGAPDGFKVDADGNVFTSGPGGVLVIDASSKLLGRIHTGKGTANVAFGGGYLYITASDRIQRVALKK